MSLFNNNQYQQYYSRNINQNTNNGFYNPGDLVGSGSGNQNNLASYFGYGAAIGAIAGTQGYRLPAQSYYNYGVNNPANYGIGTLKTTLVNSAINGALTGLVYGLTGGPSTDPTGGRLSGSGVSVGATPSNLLQTKNGKVDPNDNKEDRVVIYDQSGKLINSSSVMTPLKEKGGVIFPYTPQIQVAHRASYDMMHLVHTNYATPAYQYSSIENITFQALFTANYVAEAQYVMAMMHFFRSATKMFYGQDQLAGTPPPILFLDGYGPFTFDHIPVVVSSFDYTLPNDVDYISCNVNGVRQKVPTTLNVSLALVPTYSRNKVSNEFGLDKFSQGSLKTSGTGVRSGGWL